MVKKQVPAAGTEQRQTSHNDEPSAAFPFVGIGASAGGYEAFSQLLRALSVDTGMAFIFIQHLLPGHESALTVLLARETSMPVLEITNNMAVQPDHVYVIPPNADVELYHGILKLTPRSEAGGQHLPIDHFLRSLAHDRGNKSIGIILSGTASDGVMGLKAIKAAGGITFAQKESSAKYDGMPHSAIAAGCVDFALNPESIAHELQRLAQHPYVAASQPKQTEPLTTIDKESLDRIFLLLRQGTGVDFSYYKLTTIQRRITRRMLLHRLADLKDYLKYLQQNHTEVTALYHDILINVTEFFRDPNSFELLKEKVFPFLLNKERENNAIRIWVPGCSTGEEAYSIAICLLEFMSEIPSPPAIQIFATDIDEAAIETARAGIYPESIADNVSAARLRRFFDKVEQGYQINKKIRDVCVFARQNVFQDPPFSKIDLISCRNLLIYLGTVLQKKIMLVFHYALKPKGILFLGSAESIGEYTDLFKLIDKKNKLYEKKSITPPVQAEFIMPAYSDSVTLHDVFTKETKKIESWSGFDLQKAADRLLMHKYVPSAVVINDQMRILQFRGKTGAYLEPAAGEASLNLLKMAKEGLTLALRSVVGEAIEKNAFVRKQGIQYKSDGGMKLIDIEVTPIQHPSVTEYCYLVVFREKAAAQKVELTPGVTETAPGQAGQKDKTIKLLEQELAATKEYLQSVIEQQETSNEELRSANEEIQSSNEELQSINEELVTAKEELQSTNEELATVNDELETRNAQLAALNDDHNNLITSINIPFVIVNDDLTIRSFAPKTKELLNLIPTDIGRPITDIRPKFQLPDLGRWVATSMEEVTSKEVEFQDENHHWYSLRIRPYITAEKQLNGAVLSFIDVNDIKSSLELAADARDFAEAVVASMRHPLLVTDKNLRVVSASSAYLERFGVSHKETIGNLIYHLGNGQWGIPQLRQLLEKTIEQGESFDDFAVEHEFEHIGLQRVLVSGRYIAPGKTRAALALMQIEFVKT